MGGKVWGRRREGGGGSQTGRVSGVRPDRRRSHHAPSFRNAEVFMYTMGFSVVL